MNLPDSCLSRGAHVRWCPAIQAKFLGNLKDTLLCGCYYFNALSTGLLILSMYIRHTTQKVINGEHYCIYCMMYSLT